MNPEADITEIALIGMEFDQRGEAEDNLKNYGYRSIQFEIKALKALVLHLSREPIQ